MIARQATYRKASTRTKTRMVNNAWAVFLSKNFKCLPGGGSIVTAAANLQSVLSLPDRSSAESYLIHEMIYSDAGIT